VLRNVPEHRRDEVTEYRVNNTATSNILCMYLSKDAKKQKCKHVFGENLLISRYLEESNGE
jgi:hypothetical protein